MQSRLLFSETHLPPEPAQPQWVAGLTTALALMVGAAIYGARWLAWEAMGQ